MRGARVMSFLVGVWGLSVAPVGAQPLGSFSWQLQPYCNVVTVTVTQNGGVYTLDGYDAQCGAPQRAPLTGLATPNPDGSIGFGFSIVASPSGAPVHIAARISLATLSGTWNDSAGASGTFAFGASTGGAPRPMAALSGAHIAAGSIGASQVDTTQVQARVVGQCAAGQFVTRVNANGSLDCGSPAAATADYAGVIRSTQLDSTPIPSTAVSTATAFPTATLAFTAPRTGYALVRARGYCRLNASTSGVHALVLALLLPGETITSVADDAALTVPQSSLTNTYHQAGFAAERLVSITAGTSYQILLGAYRTSAASELAICRGTVSAMLFTSGLP